MASSLAEELTTDEIPEKLRCKVCQRLAIDAFRLPCCDESTCATCHSALTDTCPLCSHNPIAQDDCKPHKNLRQTVKSFLRSEEKKRQREKGDTDGPKATESAARAQDDNPVVNLPGEKHQHANREDHGENRPARSIEIQNAPPDDVETKATLPELALDMNGDDVPMEEDSDDSSSVEIRVSPPPSEYDEEQQLHLHNPNLVLAANMGGHSQSQDPHEKNEYNDNTTMNGFGTNGNWQSNAIDNNNMNPMMLMQNAMSGFPQLQNMMSMGMMNQAMMQQFMNQSMMFGGNMAMNNMNAMDMNAMGFNGGSFGGWNMSGGMGSSNTQGDFGNSGYSQNPRTNRGGYGRGHSARFRNENFPRGRFHGHPNAYRGFARDSGRRFSRGQSDGFSIRHSRSGSFQHTVDQNKRESLVGDDVHEVQVSPQVVEDVHSLKHAKADEADEPNKNDVAAPLQESQAIPTHIPHDESASPGTPHKVDDSYSEKPQLRDEKLTNHSTQSDAVSPTGQNESFETEERADLGLGPNVPQGPAAQYAPAEFSIRGRGRLRGVGRGAWSTRGRVASYSSVSIPSPTEPKGTGVVGAPTGPKALREGLPNIGFRGRHPSVSSVRPGRGNTVSGRNGVAPTSAGMPTDDYSHKDAPKRNRSRTPESPRHSKSRHYSFEAEDDFHDEHDARHERKHRRSSRHDDKYYDEDGKYDKRHDEHSDSEHRHRSRRDREKHRSSRHDRETSEERRRRKRAERFQMQEDYDRGKDRSEDLDARGSSRRHSRRESRRDYQESYEDHNGHRTRSPSPIRRSHEEVSHQEAQPLQPWGSFSTMKNGAPRREFKIQGRSKLSELDAQKEKLREERPDIDPYALEREARQRERLAKEEQRRGSYHLGGSSKSKRGYEDDEAFNGQRSAADFSGRKKARMAHNGRRTSYRFDEEGVDDFAAKMAKTEREREGARYK